MKKAIVYYSMSGNTEYVAEKIAGEIEADLIKIIPQKKYPNSGIKKFLWGGKSVLMGEKPKLEKYDFNPNEYDMVIFGTPVWASCFTPPIRTFIQENKNELINKKMAVFTCFMGGGADKAIDKLKKYIGIEEFKEELILIEPKNNQTEENDEKIKKFCEKINKE